MRIKNSRFAAAFDELRRNYGIKTQKELARLMGVSQDTITRIMRDYTEVTEDIITKLQTASGCIFNLQYLRGEEGVPMLAKDLVESQSQSNIDTSSLVNALIAAKDETIESLKRENEILHSRINDLERQLAEARFSDIKDYPFAVGTAEPKIKEYGK